MEGSANSQSVNKGRIDATLSKAEVPTNTSEIPCNPNLPSNASISKDGEISRRRWNVRIVLNVLSELKCIEMSELLSNASKRYCLNSLQYICKCLNKCFSFISLLKRMGFFVLFALNEICKIEHYEQFFMQTLVGKIPYEPCKKKQKHVKSSVGFFLGK